MKIRYNAEPDHSVRTLTDLVKMASNQLGIELEGDGPRWKAVQVEVGKLKRAIGKRDIGVEDLARVVRWCAREKVRVTSPVGLVYMLERVPEEVDDESADQRALERRIDDAIALEIDRSDGGRWVTRLSRASGSQREVVLREWEQERV